MKNKNIIIYLTSILSLATITAQGASAQTASANGTVTISGPSGFVQSVSGQITLPNGLYYEGPLNITPTITNATNLGALMPGTDLVVNNLTITPGNIQVVFPQTDFNAAAATALYAASGLSDIVSLIRAQNNLNGPPSSPSQATATGSVSILAPNGSTQSVSGEISLPPGLYYGGADFNITPDVEYSTDIDTVFVNNLVIDPGPVESGDPFFVTGFLPLDFNAAAAFWLYDYSLANDLSGVVSIIRAGTGKNGLLSTNQPQAKASGNITITTPNGSVESVSGELSLPTGLYYTDPLTITPTFNDYANLGTNDLLVTNLEVNPGFPSISQPWTFSAAAAWNLSNATSLSDQVSIIRAGAGTNGLE
jgi:hypothetical protein